MALSSVGLLRPTSDLTVPLQSLRTRTAGTGAKGPNAPEEGLMQKAASSKVAGGDALFKLGLRKFSGTLSRL